MQNHGVCEGLHVGVTQRPPSRMLHPTALSSLTAQGLLMLGTSPKPHLFAGEWRPPLPKEEVDKVVATESLLASSTGRVLGRRSGRPRWEPELKHTQLHHLHEWCRPSPT